MSYGETTTSHECDMSEGELIAFKAAAVKIAKGTLVCFDASAGYVTTTPTTGRYFAGIAFDTVDNSAGAAGALSARLEQKGVYDLNIDIASQTYLGKEVNWMTGSTVATGYTTFAGDSCTVTCSTQVASPKVGRIVEYVSASKVRVKIDGYASASATGT
jgi:hypothetical protein